MTTLDAAHDYIRRGWRVVPLHGYTDGHCLCRLGVSCPEKNRGKHPSIGNEWQKRALGSGADVQAWWDENADDNIGIATGVDSGLWVLDLDGAAGIRTLTDFATEHGSLPATRIVRTGSGGLHYYWKHPGHFVVRNSASWLGPGVDVRGLGGQVVAPPSVSGRGAYQLIADHPPADAPEWLLSLVHEHAGHCEAGRSAEVKAAERVDQEFLPPKVRDLASSIVGQDQGRFRHFHALVAACYEHGYTQGQAVTIAAPWCAAVGKFVGRVEAEVARCWGKLEAEAARQNEWVDGIAGPITTETRPNPTPPVDGTAALNPEPQPAEDPTEPVFASWNPVDLTSILDGSYEPETPTLFPRTDGHALLYPGRIHSFHGESESGKSLIAQAETARLLQAGHDALYIDFESDAPAVVARLRELGCSPTQLQAPQFTYVRPDTDPRASATERDAIRALLANTYTIVVIDGITDALGVFGASSKDNDDITTFMRTLPRPFAVKTGAAVVLIDHVTKDGDNRGRFAIGGQSKMAALDGAAYVVEVVEALGRGMRGSVTMRVAKDRPGGVRPYSGTFRKTDRTQEAARVIVDSTDPEKGIIVTVEPPSKTVEQGADEAKTNRPTVLMSRVSDFLAMSVGPAPIGTIQDGIRGDNKWIKTAVATLENEGYVAAQQLTRTGRGPQRVTGYVLVKPYSEASDPLSDAYVGWAETTTPETPVNIGETGVKTGERNSGEVTSSPYGDGTGVSGAAPGSKTDTPVKLPDPDLLVSCKTCFRPIGAATAAATNGNCSTCHAGLRA